MADTLIKPAIPTVTLPAAFGGIKTEFSDSKVQNGFLEGTPDILAGDNLNYWLDTHGKNQEYLRAIVDFIRNCPIGKVVSVDSNNQLYYATIFTEEYVDERSVQVGDIIMSPRASRANSLFCNGAAVSRATYAPLFAAIGTMYGSGNGSTTFNIPDMRGSFPRGYKSGLTSPIGTSQAGGLPNIYGYMDLFNGANQYFGISGNAQAQNAFFVGDYRQGWQVGTSTTTASVGNLGFDAKRANPIYGSSAEVRPINHAFNFFIKY